MKEALREKINELIGKGVQSEAECVYFLSQIRKYMEQQSIPGYRNLRMCMNWALHSSINRGAVENILKEIEEFIASKDNISQNLGFEGFEELQNKLLFVQPLKIELLSFLKTHGFETSICDDESKYEMFLRYFGRVIEDTPLVLNNKTTSNQSLEVSISKISDFDQPIKYKWIVTYEKGTIELNPLGD